MDHPQLSRTDMIIPFADGPDGRAAVDAWRAHVEAGRIGRRAAWRPHPEDAQ